MAATEIRGTWVYVEGRWPGGLNFKGAFETEVEARNWCAEHGVKIDKLYPA